MHARCRTRLRLSTDPMDSLFTGLERVRATIGRTCDERILLNIVLKKNPFDKGKVPPTTRERRVRRVASAASNASTGQEAEQVRDPQALDQVHQTSARGVEVRHYWRDSYESESLIFLVDGKWIRRSDWRGVKTETLPGG